MKSVKSIKRWSHTGLAILAFAIVSILLFTLAQSAQALPSFARKYNTSCMTCHIAPPVLNAFGEAFMNNGYRMPSGDEDLIEQEQTPLGASGWKRVWPKGIWPSDIPGGNYLAMGLRTGFNWNPSAPAATDFEGIHAFNLFMGGTGGESFSFFGNMAAESHGGGALETEFERLFAQYNHPSRLFNVTVGNFEPRGIPFSSHRGFVHEANYLANDLSTPAGTASLHDQDGMELWGGVEGPGQRGGFFWNFGVVNGNFAASPLAGELHEEEEHGEEPGHVERALSFVTLAADDQGGEEEHAEEAAGGHGGGFDNNSNKDVYFLASYKIGGLGIFGGGASDSLEQTQNWRDNHLTLGGYLYRGRGPAEIDEVFQPSANRFLRTGAFFDWGIHDFGLKGGYQFNRDEVEVEAGHDIRLYRADVLTAEARYVLPYPWVVPYVRFESVNPNFGNNFTRTTIAGIVMLRANIMLDIQGFLSNAPALYDDKFRVGFRVFF